MAHKLDLSASYNLTPEVYLALLCDIDVVAVHVLHPAVADLVINERADVVEDNAEGDLHSVVFWKHRLGKIECGIVVSVIKDEGDRTVRTALVDNFRARALCRAFKPEGINADPSAFGGDRNSTDTAVFRGGQSYADT